MYAIYARQSVEKADSISIESQIEFCRYEARGEACKLYIDRGYSGKNTQRPQFQELLRDIQAGSIEKVIVYKLDRISRSILDFSNMMEIFRRHQVAFVSSTEKFDTSSPMGRAMLHICIVFAQLERETIQRRVADAYASRSQKSFYMGGRVPYGYRLEAAEIKGVKTAKYVFCPEEAEQARLIFQLYAAPETSYGDVLHALGERGWLRRGKPWNVTELFGMLRNPVYVRADASVYEFYSRQGSDIVSPPQAFSGKNGCYLYKGKEAGKNKNADLAGQVLVLAPHEGMVPADIWLSCRIKCLENRQVQPGRKAVGTWLAGRVKCGRCGYALLRKFYKQRAYSYFRCSNQLRSKACPGCGILRASEFEALIFAQMAEKLRRFPILTGGQTSIDPRGEALRAQLALVEREMKKLADSLGDLSGTLQEYAGRRARELEQRGKSLAQSLAKLEENHNRRQLTGYLRFWDALSFEEKRRAAGLLIEKIEATEEKIRITWKL